MSEQENKEPTLLIPVPRPIQRAKNRGIESTSGPKGCFVQYRGTEFEKERIKEAAEFLGVSYGTFMRSVTNAAAIRVLEMKEKFNAN